MHTGLHSEIDEAKAESPDASKIEALEQELERMKAEKKQVEDELSRLMDDGAHGDTLAVHQIPERLHH